MRFHAFPTLFLLISSVISADPIIPELIYTLDYGVGGQALSYQNDFRGSSPHQFSSIDGRKVWIGQSNGALIVDIFSADIEKYMPYTQNKSGGYDVDFVFGRGWAVGNRGNPVVMGLDIKNGHVDNFKYYYDDDDSYKLMISNVYIVRDKAFFFQEDGSFLCIPKGNVPLSFTETVSMLQSWIDNEQNSDLETKRKQLELIKTGKFLVVDGIHYPATDQNFREYLAAMGRDTSALRQRSDNGSPIVGLSQLGEIYIRKGETVLVLNQNGSLLSTISIASLMIPSGDQERILDFFVHQNGDFYVMNAVKGDKVYIFKAARTWGHDILNIARAGVRDDRESSILSRQLREYSGAELRFLRNAVFALKGYDFQSWDLKVYFSGYDWYLPQNKQSNDISKLAEPQKRLVTLILEEEKRRT